MEWGYHGGNIIGLQTNQSHPLELGLATAPPEAYGDVKEGGYLNPNSFLFGRKKTGGWEWSQIGNQERSPQQLTI